MSAWFTRRSAIVGAAVLGSVVIAGTYALASGEGGGGHDMSAPGMDMSASASKDAAPHDMASMANAPHDMASMGGEDAQASASGPGRGTSSSDAGYSLLLTSAQRLQPGDTTPLTFRVVADGQTVTSFADENGKKMHLIVVRRDMTGFQHVHPTMDSVGTWSVPLRLGAPGSYRAFADFLPAEREASGELPLALGVDLTGVGSWKPVDLPPATATSTADGMTAQLAGTATAGKASELTFTISDKAGKVTDLEPYLGSYGHLVALRDGDLAYLHVHPISASAGNPSLTFGADLPTAGRYRLFLQVQRGGKVTLLPYTLEVPAA